MGDNAVDFTRCKKADREDILATFKADKKVRNMNVHFHNVVTTYLDAGKEEEEALPEDEAPPEDEDDNLEDRDAAEGEQDEEYLEQPADEDAPPEEDIKELSWQEQEKAMGAFNPPSDTQNMNSKFLAFIRKGGKGGGKGKTPCKFWSSGSCKSGSSCPFSHDGPAGGSDSRSSHRKESREEAAEEGPDAEALNLFVDAWDLSHEAQDMLFSLEGSTAFKVIEKFSPKADVGDVSGMFMGYAKSILRNAGGSKGGDQWKRSADGGDDKSWKKPRW